MEFLLTSSGISNRPDDELIPLDRQDRSLWDRAEIAEGPSAFTVASGQ